MAPNTLAVVWSYTRSMFKAAVADRLIPYSPCERVRVEPAARRPIRPPSIEEIEAITAELPARWAAIGLLGAQTGMRPGELLGLCVDQVDFLRKTITVDRQLRDGVVVAEPKTEASRRVIPIGDVTVELLAAHLAAWPAGSGGLVFRKSDGFRPLSARETAKSSARAVVRAGIGRRVRLHDMRHFYASSLLAEGASVVVVQARLGHKRAAETTDTYGHVIPAEEDRTCDMVTSIFATRVLRASWPERPRALTCENTPIG